MPYFPSVIQTASDGPGVLGAGDDTKVLAWNNATKKFVMATASAGGTPGGSDTQVQFNDGGAFGGDSGLTFNKTTNVLTAGGLTVTLAANVSGITSTGYSVTGSGTTPMIDLAGTWNTSGTVTAIKANITNTASNANSLLIDLQTDGSTMFRVRRDGVTFSTTGFRSANGNNFNDNGLVLATNTAYFAWTDLKLYRNAAGILEINNNTPGTFRDLRARNVDLSGGTTAIASTRIRSGVAPTSPLEGDMWYDGTSLFFRDSTTSRTITWT